METLKISFYTLITACLLVTGTALHAQGVAQQTAFSESYGHEANLAYTKAIESILKVHTDKTYETSLRLGWLYYLQQDYPKSIGFYEKAIALMPYSVEARLGYVLPAAALGNWDDVIRVYKDVLKNDPGNSSVNYRLGLIYYNKGEYSESGKYLEKVINMYPFDYDGVVLAGWNYLKMGKMPEAKVLFNRTLLISPGDTSALEGLKSCQ